jgi:hypothetical protein
MGGISPDKARKPIPADATGRRPALPGTSAHAGAGTATWLGPGTHRGTPARLHGPSLMPRG